MRAFKYEDGRAVPVEWTDLRVRALLPVTNMRVDEAGLRFFKSEISAAYLIWIAWPFAHVGTGQRVVLYLPEGVEPTEEHGRALDQATRRS